MVESPGMQLQSLGFHLSDFLLCNVPNPGDDLDQSINDIQIDSTFLQLQHTHTHTTTILTAFEQQLQQHILLVVVTIKTTTRKFFHNNNEYAQVQVHLFKCQKTF